MTDNEERVSGNIFAVKSTLSNEGEDYYIRSKNGNGWGLPVRDIEPDDLRVLADRIESIRTKGGWE